MPQKDLKKQLLLVLDKSPLFNLLPEGVKDWLRHFYSSASEEQMEAALKTLNESDQMAEPIQAKLEAVSKQETDLRAEAHHLIGRAKGIIASLNQDKDQLMGEKESDEILAMLERPNDTGTAFEGR